MQLNVGAEISQSNFAGFLTAGCTEVMQTVDAAATDRAGYLNDILCCALIGAAWEKVAGGMLASSSLTLANIERSAVPAFASADKVCH